MSKEDDEFIRDWKAAMAMTDTKERTRAIARIINKGGARLAKDPFEITELPDGTFHITPLKRQ